MNTRKAQLAMVAGAALSLAGCLQGFEDHSRFDKMPRILPAAAEGDLDWIKTDVKNHGNVNVTNISGDTALMWAADRDQAEVIRYLLFHGANPWLENKSGQTALDIAKKSGAKRAINILEDYMARNPPGPAAQTPSGKTAKSL
jgi:ankyrin repeat protein